MTGIDFYLGNLERERGMGKGYGRNRGI